MPPCSQRGLYQPHVRSCQPQFPRATDRLITVTSTAASLAFFHCNIAFLLHRIIGRQNRLGILNLLLTEVIPRRGDSREASDKAAWRGFRSVPVTIEPEPPEDEREAIVAALAEGQEAGLGAWELAALADGIEEDELDP